MTTVGANPPQQTPGPGRADKRRPALRTQINKIARWLHLYLSMVSFAVILFFAATGLTLNHPNWFSSAIKISERHGTLDLAQQQPAALAQTLRTREHLHGTLDEPRIDDTQVSFSFRAPGYTADVAIDKPAGTYTVTETRNGFVAVLNDLHKGHDAGRAWSWLIDASAILLTLVSLTGLIILWFIYKRRTSGLLLAAAGLALVLLAYRIFVP